MGEAVEAALSQDILGTHVDVDSVLVYIKDRDAQISACARLRVYFQPPGEDEEPASWWGESQFGGAEDSLAASRRRMAEPHLR